MLKMSSFKSSCERKMISVAILMIISAVCLNYVSGKKEGEKEKDKKCTPEVVAIKKTKIIPVAVPVRSNKKSYRVKVPAAEPE